MDISSFDILTILESLQKERHVFANEIDFQISMCEIIKKEMYEESIHVVPEFTYLGEHLDDKRRNNPNDEKKNYCDIVVYDDNTKNKDAVVIELKYKVTTKYVNDAFKYQVTPRNPKGQSDLSHYCLSNQGADDVGSLLFLEDMYRVQKIMANIDSSTEKYHLQGLNPIKGYCIFLTNDPSYLNTGSGTNNSKVKIFTRNPILTPTPIDNFDMGGKNYNFSPDIPGNGFRWYVYSNVVYDSKDTKQSNKDCCDFNILVLEYSSLHKNDVASLDLSALGPIKHMQ